MFRLFDDGFRRFRPDFGQRSGCPLQKHAWLARFDVADLGDMVPDTIAMNITGEWYDDGLTYANFTVTPITVEEQFAEPTQPDVLLGDVNGDGKISIADARGLLVKIAAAETDDEALIAVADMDGNGKISIADARAILVLIANGQ